jgi:hypothetical protein
MTGKSSPVPSVEVLRELARAQGVEPGDDDLAFAAGFLATILPALREIEASVPPGTPSGGLPEVEDAERPG